MLQESVELVNKICHYAGVGDMCWKAHIRGETYFIVLQFEGFVSPKTCVGFVYCMCHTLSLRNEQFLFLESRS